MFALETACARNMRSKMIASEYQSVPMSGAAEAFAASRSRHPTLKIATICEDVGKNLGAIWNDNWRQRGQARLVKTISVRDLQDMLGFPMDLLSRQAHCWSSSGATWSTISWTRRFVCKFSWRQPLVCTSLLVAIAHVARHAACQCWRRAIGHIC